MLLDPITHLWKTAKGPMINALNFARVKNIQAALLQFAGTYA